MACQTYCWVHTFNTTSMQHRLMQTEEQCSRLILAHLKCKLLDGKGSQPCWARHCLKHTSRYGELSKVGKCHLAMHLLVCETFLELCNKSVSYSFLHCKILPHKKYDFQRIIYTYLQQESFQQLFIYCFKFSSAQSKKVSYKEKP